MCRGWSDFIGLHGGSLNVEVGAHVYVCSMYVL